MSLYLTAKSTQSSNPLTFFVFVVVGTAGAALADALTTGACTEGVASFAEIVSVGPADALAAGGADSTAEGINEPFAEVALGKGTGMTVAPLAEGRVAMNAMPPRSTKPAMADAMTNVRLENRFS